MGWQSKERRKARWGKTLNESSTFNDDDPKQSRRIAKLKEDLSALAGGDAVFGVSPDCPADVWESSLEDILEFESVGSGISLFEGLQLHGMDLPSPERLDEMQSARKVMEVLHALEDLRVFLIGFDEMTACELYSTLWNQTLWEGCYVRKRHPGAITLIDVSHKMQRSDMLRFLEDLSKTGSIH